MTLRRRSPISEWTQFWIRMALLLALLIFIVGVHWIERDALKDTHDGSVSFADVIYFTMISATTTGYGDVVPVTERARLFDALIVTPIRIVFILILAGTAYTFVIRKTWNKWVMQMIQKNLRDHVVLAGYGVSNSKALVELLARGHDPASIVVIDHNEENLVRATKCGVAVLQGDAARNETLEAARLDQARALLVSAGRDDSNILVILTARKVAPNVNISVTIRESDNEDIARHAGADTVINPVSFSGLLLASSLEGPYRADYLADLASNEGSVLLRERLVEANEVGRSPTDLCTGQAVRIIRGDATLGPKDSGFARIEAGDRILEIVDET